MDDTPEPEGIPPRPVAIPFSVDLIPAEFAAMPRWVAWRYYWDDKREDWTKLPVNPRNGRNASSTNPQTWGTLEAAVARSKFPGMDGIGFMMGGGLVGVDLDHCIDENGKLSKLAADVVKEFATYSEKSPSGTGLRLIGKGVNRLPRDKGAHERKIGLEVYVKSRFLTITGLRIAGDQITDCAGAVAWLYDTHLPHKKDKASKPQTQSKPSEPVDASDAEIIELMTKRAKNAGKVLSLWKGEIPAGKSHSEADLALLNHIAFYVGPFPDRIDRIFRLSELGKRGRWTEREEYRHDSIEKALEGKTKFYERPTKVKMKGVGAHEKSSDNSPPSEPLNPVLAGGEPQTGTQIITTYFRKTYQPQFKDGNTIVCRDGRRVPMLDGTSRPNSRLIEALAFAKDAPSGEGGEVKRSQLPTFFGKWAKVAWGDLLDGLLEEDEVEIGQGEPVAEEFRRMVRDAMLSEVVLGSTVRAGKEEVTQTERRSLIGWCKRFKKPRWAPIRSKRCWCKESITEDGECVLLVAVHHDLFAQVKADRRLCAMTSNRFNKRAAKYGVGKPDPSERPEGERAVILDSAFVSSMLEDIPDAEDDHAGEGDDGTIPMANWQEKNRNVDVING